MTLSTVVTEALPGDRRAGATFSRERATCRWVHRRHFSNVGDGEVVSGLNFGTFGSAGVQVQASARPPDNADAARAGARPCRHSRRFAPDGRVTTSVLG